MQTCFCFSWAYHWEQNCCVKELLNLISVGTANLFFQCSCTILHSFFVWLRPLWWKPSSHLPGFSFLRFCHDYFTAFHLHLLPINRLPLMTWKSDDSEGRKLPAKVTLVRGGARRTPQRSPLARVQAPWLSVCNWKWTKERQAYFIRRFFNACLFYWVYISILGEIFTFQIGRTLPSAEENNEFFPVYIKYNILVCYPGVKNQLQLELWDRKRGRPMVIWMSFEFMKGLWDTD